jgi:hypothetical protein
MAEPIKPWLSPEQAQASPSCAALLTGITATTDSRDASRAISGRLLWWRRSTSCLSSRGIHLACHVHRRSEGYTGPQTVCCYFYETDTCTLVRPQWRCEMNTTGKTPRGD